MTNVFDYIAESNVNKAQALCDQHGEPADNIDDISQSLQEIASSNEDGLTEVMKLHPDKNVLVEMFGKQNKKFSNATGNSNYGSMNTMCPTCRLDGMLLRTRAADGTNSATMATASTNNTVPAILQTQTNTIITVGIIAALLLAVIVVNKNDNKSN